MQGDEPRMSYEDYLRWHDIEGNLGEWIDGEVVRFQPPDQRHQEVAGFLLMLLKIFVDARNFGRVLLAPFELRLGETRSSREPDILYLAQDHADLNDGQRWYGADLVVEIVSDESVQRDRRDKWSQYAAAGIPEYRIVAPRPGRESIELFSLTGEGYYAAIPAHPDGRIGSRVLTGLSVDPAWIALDPLPNPIELLQKR